MSTPTIATHAEALAQLAAVCEETRAFAWILPAASVQALGALARWSTDPHPDTTRAAAQRLAAYQWARTGDDEASGEAQDAGRGTDYAIGLSLYHGAAARSAVAGAVKHLAMASGQIQAGDDTNRAEGLVMLDDARKLLTAAVGNLAAWHKGILAAENAKTKAEVDAILADSPED